MARKQLLALTICVFFVACLWSTCSAQDIDRLNQHLVESASRKLQVEELASQINFQEIKNALEKVNFWSLNLAEGDGSHVSPSFPPISNVCRNALERIWNTTNTVAKLLTVLELVDATGKVPAGLFQGNVFADGAYDECFSMPSTSYCTGFVNISTTVVPIPSPIPLGWKFGMCVPKGCTQMDIAKTVNATVVLVANGSEIACASSKRPPYNAGAIVMITVCCLLVALAVVGSLIHCIVILLKDGLEQFVDDPAYTPANHNQDKELSVSEKTPLLEKAVDTQTKPKRFDPMDFVTAFSLFKIIPTILSTKQPPSAITCINGLRVISIFWVILCHNHMWFLQSVGADNTFIMKDVVSRFSFQAILNGFVSVDSFFFLSGLLVAYLSFRQMARNKGRFPFIAYYVHRYLRLTPAYAFVLFFVWFMSMHVTDGPYYPSLSWVGSLGYENCAKYWWTNLLYINNLYPWKLQEECIGWSWYLANDMQFFVIAPVIIIPMYFILPLGISLLIGFLLFSFISTGIINGVYDFQASLFAPFAYNYTTNVTATFTDVLYIKPWHRISPYLVGLALGYLLYRKARFPFHRLVNLILYLSLWLAAAAILIPTLYGLYPTWHGHIPSMAENILYNVLFRFAWGVGLALIVFACHNGYGWFINSFLSMKFWIPLSRLSYNAYLVHPFVLTVFYGSLRKAIHYDDLNLAFQTVANIVVSFGVAALVSVFVEFPLGNVEQALFKIVGLSGRESTRQGTQQAGGEHRSKHMKNTHIN